MSMLSSIWDFLKDGSNQAVLKWIGSGIAALAVGIWGLIKAGWIKWKLSHPKQTSEPYLRYEDASFLAAPSVIWLSYSAWAKWFASQHLASNNHQPVAQPTIMNVASSLVLDALVDGK